MNNEEKKFRSPIFFKDNPEELRVNPLYIIDDSLSTNTRFAITKLTQNGKYIRGGMLFYNLNGLELYTDIENAMFIDLENKTVFIRKYEEVLEQVSSDDPETRQYVLLLYSEETKETTWESIEGRTATYEWIRDNIDLYDFDPDQSVILTPNVAFKDALSVTKFIQHLQNTNLVDPEEFDISIYRYNIPEDE